MTTAAAPTAPTTSDAPTASTWVPQLVDGWIWQATTGVAPPPGMIIQSA